MKKNSNSFFIAVLGMMFGLMFSSCIKDSCHRTYNYSYYEPVYKTTAEVKANIKSNTAVEIQNPGKIYILGNYIFLNEVDKGIHIIDNSNPASPINKAFINIPGNMDMAVKGNILYADLYTDLVTIDISNPLNAIVKKYNEGVFPFRSYGNGFSADRSKVIVDWVKRDTTVTESCSLNRGWLAYSGAFFLADASSSGDSKASVSPIGLGGSMARFTLVNNRMYTVSYSDLNVFNISSPENPIFSSKVFINSGTIETIFPLKDKLFLGSQNGMFIYSIINPDNPALTGQFAHSVSCDPVIADDNYAYITLRSGATCRTASTNQLDILKLNNFTNAQLLKSYPFSNPHGLSKDGNLLFICDGISGLKIYDASDVMNLRLVKEITGSETYDVIAYNNIALVVAKDGLYQYDYSNVNNIRLLSKIDVLKK